MIASSNAPGTRAANGLKWNSQKLTAPAIVQPRSMRPTANARGISSSAATFSAPNSRKTIASTMRGSHALSWVIPPSRLSASGLIPVMRVSPRLGHERDDAKNPDSTDRRGDPRTWRQQQRDRDDDETE